ncbi:MAG: hypothetical protein HY909_09590 [Deltaproteobacteria bacterium]|nr:hypothetical protein [Deltaproteobacteria bacterium]
MVKRSSSGKKPPGKGTALVRREAPAAPAVVTALDDAQRKLLAEALRRAEETRDAVEGALVGLGRWLLVQVFDDDAAAALDGRHQNPVWRELLSRAGGPTLRLSERVLYVALHVAAHDKRITDEAWRGLDVGRKELLLPLGDEDQLREAAQHVTAMKLTQRETREYVGELLAGRGDDRAVRLTAPRITAQVRAFRARVAAATWQRRALAVLKGLEDDKLVPVRREVEALRAWAEAFLARLPRR